MDKSPRRLLPYDMAQRIESWIRVGRYTPGSQLPPSVGWRSGWVPPATCCARALRILETRGSVQFHHGIGTFVSKHFPDGASEIPVNLTLPDGALPNDQVMVARRSVECAVVEVAARCPPNATELAAEVRLPTVGVP